MSHSNHPVARSPNESEMVTTAREVSRARYRRALTWAFTFFNAIRVVAYLPTIWAIYVSGDASQHSLLTWLSWTGANATMALWLYEMADQKLNRAITVNLCNALMCLTTVLLIVSYRVGH